MDQTHQRRFFESLGTSAWTTVCESWYEKGVRNGGIYCALAPQSSREKALNSPSWDVTKGDFAPGFSQHHDDNGEWVTTYESGGGHNGFEPLVLLRDYHGAVPSTLEVVEHFRIFHNLYWDDLTSQFMKLNDDGTSFPAVKIVEGRKVEILTKLIRQYQAARQVDLLLYIDSVCIGAKGEDTPEPREWSTDTLNAALYSINNDDSRGAPCTRYLGTKVLTPPPIEKCGIWPYEGRDNHYPDFVIGVDEDGEEISYTCNHEALADYFGANPDAPHYLTPVHFRPEVLRKYYDKPELYTVSDGRLSCAGLWGVQIDNSAQESVVVFLGDLGRDLPKKERDYWRSFNIAPTSPVSETFIRRSFLGQFAESSAEDMTLRSRYTRLNKSWTVHYGWDLFRKPEEEDAGLLQRLHLPLDNSQAEVESAIRIMTQLLVDAINEKQIQALLPDKQPNERGISKLERWLGQESYPHTKRDIQFLRNLQEIRSKVTAHRKGSDYKNVWQKVFGDLQGREAIRTFFQSAIAMVNGLEEWVASVEAE